jgi:hypothetical protein
LAEYPSSEPNLSSTALVFTLLLVAVFALHAPLLRLPYFWDEAGYYVPAARDLLLTGSLIPHSTPSNAHPPLVMAYLALCWKLLGYAPVVTRTAMVVVAAFSLLGVFRLARRVSNLEVALASTICTALYPVFFAQSSLAQVDLGAAGLTFWALHSYVDGKRIRCALWFSLAVLAKETALLAPLALFAWEALGPVLKIKVAPARSWRSLWLLLPCIPLGLWYAYHYAKTGFVFGNPEFFRYNVQGTLEPLRIVLAFFLRLWQTFGYLNLSVLTIAMLLAMWRSPIHDAGSERPRMALQAQYAFYCVIAAYVVAMAMIGGAVLARYMLPAVPLVIIVAVSTLRRRLRFWKAVVAIVIVGFAVGLFVNPPYGFTLEDNLAYRDYIVLHQHAEDFLEARFPVSRVLTAWPASDELTRPYLGYVTRPMRVFRIEDFTVEQVMSAADARSNFDVALVFSTKYEPVHPMLERWYTWQRWKAKYFGYHRDVPAEAAAQVLGGQLVYSESRQGQWVGVIEMQQEYDARVTPMDPPGKPQRLKP